MPIPTAAIDPTALQPWWPRAVREAPGLTAVAAVVLLVFRPLVGLDTLLVTPEGPTNISDMLNASYPFHLLLGQALAHGHLPLWTDQFLCGYPLLANPAVGTFYPLNWTFAFLPGPAAMSLVILLTCVLAGWFTYCYARVLGLDRVPATLGGISFAVCGLFVCHAKHMALIASACWLPLLFALVERAVTDRGAAGRRAALWLAPALALSLVAGGTQAVYLALLAVTAYALVRLASRLGREWRWRLARAGVLAAAVTCGTALASVQLLPTLELSHVSERAAGLDLKQTDPAPMPPADLLTLVSARAVGRASDYSYQRNNPKGGLFWEDYVYAGLPVALLAVVGLPWSLRRWPQARILLLLGLAGAVLALGERGGLFPDAFRNLPGLSLFRFPERFLLWTEFAVVIFGAAGAQVMLGWLRGHLRTLASAALLLLAAVDLVLAQSPQNVYYPAETWLTPPDTVTTVRSGLAARAASVQTFWAHY